MWDEIMDMPGEIFDVAQLDEDEWVGDVLGQTDEHIAQLIED
jgi:hypothetical protein